MSRRVQNRVEIHQDGFESADVQGNLQKPFISNLDDTPEQSESSERITDLETEASPDSASSFISRTQSSEKTLATVFNKMSGSATHNQTSQSLLSGVLHSFVELTHNFPSKVLLEAPAQHIFYCGAGICSMALFACFCCWMDLLRTASKSKNFAWQSKASPSSRNQYIHRERVVYEWEQSSETMTLYTQLPTGVKKKDIEVKFWPRHMKMGRAGKAPFIKEELFNYVAVDECKWDVTRSGELAISLPKATTEDWPCVFKAHHPDRRK
jgi:hypothetical protein